MTSSAPRGRPGRGRRPRRAAGRRATPATFGRRPLLRAGALAQGQDHEPWRLLHLGDRPGEPLADEGRHVARLVLKEEARHLFLRQQDKKTMLISW